mmetsp:Transcript_64701/g.152100  ORF Transcript_64701/g.152100 Transcript_64701/m.152100 type:complete len:369 (+) Transcript_64701:45-1151(+)
MAAQSRRRGARPAGLLLVAPIFLLAWACSCSLSFVVGVSPRSALPPQRGGAQARSGPEAASGSSRFSASLLTMGSIAMIMASASSRAKLVGRKAEEVEDWSLDSVSRKFAEEVATIRKMCKDLPEDFDDTKLLRYALQHPGKPGDAAANVKEVLEWRAGEGAAIVKAATEAIAKAQEGGGWDNKPVLEAAPHAAKVSKYITPSQMVVVSTKAGDLVTCIRASTIDSEGLMKEVSEEEMTEFFIYAREVNSAMAEFRTRATGHVCRLISANDLTGVSKFPDQAFQNALTGSAKRAVTLYPGYSGPTILLNLPWLARMLVSILTPLFPGAVREKIKFARGPMSYMEDLKDVVKEPLRSQFVDDLQAVLNS